MASNPVKVAVPTGAWLKIATAVQYGVVKILNFDAAYHFTYRLTGEAEPVTDPLDSQRCNTPEVYIYADADIDVYVYCPDEVGSIEVAV